MCPRLVSAGLYLREVTGLVLGDRGENKDAVSQSVSGLEYRTGP